VSEAFDAMGDVALQLEGFKKCANGGVRGGIGEGGEDISGGSRAALIEDVHDLAFAPAELLLVF